jgi:hypothetical protein
MFCPLCTTTFAAISTNNYTGNVCPKGSKPDTCSLKLSDTICFARVFLLSAGAHSSAAHCALQHGRHPHQLLR